MARLALLLLLALGRARAACKVVPLEARSHLLGDTVMSGTVKSFYMKVRPGGRMLLETVYWTGLDWTGLDWTGLDWTGLDCVQGSGRPFAGKVKVRRVFRGEAGLEGRTVLVEGLGSRDICVSTPRLGDTKVFLLDSTVRRGRALPGVPRFRLRDSVLKVNLRNLKVLWRLEERALCNFTCPGAGAPLCGADGVEVKEWLGL
jgi:hypothetical protein